MRTHYIYAFFDGERPFYIGQGKIPQRKFWFQYAKLDGCHYGVKSKLKAMRDDGKEPIVHVIVDNLTKSEADTWERGLILSIGRRFNRSGPLYNLAEGGGGCRGSYSSEVQIINHQVDARGVHIYTLAQPERT